MSTTATKERPILFTGEMVRAILEGRKTQTRRVVKPQPPKGWEFNGFNISDEALFYPRGISDEEMRELDRRDPRWASPYGRRGEALWVREKWSRYRGFGQDVQDNAPVLYAADKDKCDQYPCQLDGKAVLVSARGPWRPSIHMPRWASRITLEITDVRVERLCEISEEDAAAEGIGRYTRMVPTGYGFNIEEVSRRTIFKRTWEEIHGASSWDAGTWVWAISFRRLKP